MRWCVHTIIDTMINQSYFSVSGLNWMQIDISYFIFDLVSYQINKSSLLSFFCMFSFIEIQKDQFYIFHITFSEHKYLFIYSVSFSKEILF